MELEQARRRAKDLVAAARRGETDAVARLPGRHEPPRLADAQHAVALELGFRSWPALVRSAEVFAPASYDDVDWRRVRRVTVVPFLLDGRLVLVEAGDRLVLPAGAVGVGEDPLVETVLRVPLRQAGFRRQGTHVLAVSANRRHAAFWVDGSRYHGRRLHRRDAPWWTGSAAEGARLLHAGGEGAFGRLVEAAEAARGSLTDAAYFADSQRLLDAAFLAAGTAEGGSGFGGSPAEWREERSIICDAIDRDGTFLDVGCANGHLMDSVARWSAERGRRVEPFGVDISAGLVVLARRRLPHWADRIWQGNALDWTPPQSRRFDFVHTLLDVVPENRQGDLLVHLLETAVAPGGRLIVSHYVTGEPEFSAEAMLRRLGYEPAGVTRRPSRPGRPLGAPSAWLVRRS